MPDSNETCYHLLMKTIVITGGSDGIGKALAYALAPDYKVIILARNEEALQRIGQETGCEWYVCDVRNAQNVREVIDEIASKYGSIDVLINNAGIIVNGDVTETDDKIVKDVIDTNTTGAIYVAKHTLKHMKKQQSGLIVNVVSQSGLIARANRSIYNASKWAMTGFTKAIQDEAFEYGVRVTGFYPGTVKTELFAKAGLELNTVALSTDTIVEAINFLLTLPDTVIVPELGMKAIR